MDSYKVIGRRTPRVDGVKQVTGQTEFVADMYLPHLLHAKVLLSSEHHARILDIDTSAAERLPGVKGIITWRDVPYNRFSADSPADQPVLAEGKVRYKGEPVAVIAAETEEIAMAARDLIKVKYERLDAVFDPREAMKDGAPIIHEEGQGIWARGNVIINHFGNTTLTTRWGDVERGFADSDLVLEETYATSAQKTAPIENHVSMARPEGSDKLTIWTSYQMVFSGSPMCARILKMPQSRIRLIAPAVGGGFGGKNDLTWEPMVGLLALKTNRPVRLTVTAEEDFMYATTKHQQYITIKTGVKKDGRIMARYVKLLTDAGAYRTFGVFITMKGTYLGAGPYRIANVWIDGTVVYTNKQPGGSFRGYGCSQPTFAYESHTDMLAERLGMDPMEFRLRNCFAEGDRIPTGQALRGVGIRAVYEKLREISGWDEKKRDGERERPDRFGG